jgi:hypothetical protein
MIGASGLRDDNDSKNDGLKWKLAESVCYGNNIFMASPLSSFSKFKSHLTLSKRPISVYISV